MSPTKSISTCFRKYAYFKGRARRSEFWWFFLFCAVLALILSLIYIPFFMLALLVPYLAVSARRLHDTGSSALWLLMIPLGILGFLLTLVLAAVLEVITSLQTTFGAEAEMDWTIPVIGIAFFAGCSMLPLVFCVRSGTVGPNRYGPDPLTSAPDADGSGGFPYASTPADPLSETEPGRRNFCRRCGTRLPQDGGFCTGCGRAI